MNDFDTLPYQLHTGQELHLMLEGVKPLACFCHEYPSPPCEEIVPEVAFDEHVQRGRFERREYVELVSPATQARRHPIKGIRHVLYAQPSEAWRIDAYIDLKARAAITGWSAEFERLEGRLLGYEDWQTDAWLAMLRARPNAHRIPWLARLAEKSHGAS